MTDTHLTDTRFDGFDLPEPLLRGIHDAGFQRCTPIQAESLPIALSGRDVAGQAQTGTGKTAAFLVAAINHLLQHPPPENRRDNQPRVLIVAPTRELAVQIHSDAEVLTKHLDLRLGLAFGGTDYDKQRNTLSNGVDILIGTPGRLIDFFKQHVYDLKAAQVVIMDEADRMFDLGFIKDVRYLLRRCPPPGERLGMLFSATLSYRVTELAYEHMNNPETVIIEPEQVTAEQVVETGYMTANEEKIPLLIGLLRKMPDAHTIVFVNTKRAADQVWGFLQGNGFDAAILSGDVPQKKRLSLLKRFANAELHVLVATDVAARGLHIPDVSHVINYDLPEDAEDYVHRIGRTARAGAKGDAISFACETYSFSLPDIEKYIGHRIPMEPVSGELLADIDPGSRVRPDRESRINNRDRKPDGRRKGGGRSAPGPRREDRKATKPEGSAPGPEGGDKPKKPRRRRRKPGSGQGQQGQPRQTD